MKIYVVTEGEYSDYCIRAVFTEKKNAERYAYLIGGCVEEYESDKINNPEMIEIRYYTTANEINVEEGYCGEDRISSWNNDLFLCYVPFSERMAQAEDKGELKALLLKIAQDRYAQYMAKELGL